VQIATHLRQMNALTLPTNTDSMSTEVTKSGIL
jgi:hypothetical protein